MATITEDLQGNIEAPSRVESVYALNRYLNQPGCEKKKEKDFSNPILSENKSAKLKSCDCTAVAQTK